MKNQLTEKQSKMPYAKFFSYAIDEYGIPEDLQERIQKGYPLDPEKALKLEDINRALEPDYDVEDEGYCIMPDGSGYISEKFFYPGVTKEMFEWWFAWHGIEDTRYRIWDPKAHYGVKVSKRNLQKRTDSSLNWKERNWNTCDFVMAYTVDGISVVKISFLRPRDFGFDEELMKKYDISAVSAITGKPDQAIPDSPNTRILRETPEGLHVWCYFWYGMYIINKKPIKVDDYVCSEEMLQLQVSHCAEEYTRLGKILPLVYEENHLIVDKAEDFEPMPF